MENNKKIALVVGAALAAFSAGKLQAADNTHMNTNGMMVADHTAEHKAEEGKAKGKAAAKKAKKGEAKKEGGCSHEGGTGCGGDKKAAEKPAEGAGK